MHGLVYYPYTTGVTKVHVPELPLRLKAPPSGDTLWTFHAQPSFCVVLSGNVLPSPRLEQHVRVFALEVFFHLFASRSALPSLPLSAVSRFHALLTFTELPTRSTFGAT